MHNIQAGSGSVALAEGIRHLLLCGKEDQSRNGPVLVAPTPVTTTYTRPWQHVIFSPARDANPFFHLMEAVWMLAGCNGVAFLQQFNSTIGQFSDDGKVLGGAYGYRWRSSCKFDQLPLIIEELRQHPDSRRAVLSMWDKFADLSSQSKDVPCNTHIYFSLKTGKLNMMVCNRSNDIIWGCYGANLVHMSLLQHYIAAALKVPVGHYHQMSYNFHAYNERHHRKWLEGVMLEADCEGLYPGSWFDVKPMFTEVGSFDEELTNFVNGLPCTQPSWLVNVCGNARLAWGHHKVGDRKGALTLAGRVASPDWAKACTEWLERRYAKA